MIRVLHCLGGLGTGGVEKLILSWYRKIDRNNVQFDFLVRSEEENYIDEITRLGGRVFFTAEYPKHLIRNYLDTINVLKRKEWDIVHIHGNAAMYITVLLLAKKFGIKCRIMHSHSTNSPNLIYKFIHYMNRNTVICNSDVKLACSYDAGKWMFGSEKFHFLKNAVDVEKFSFDKEARDKIRNEFNIEQKFVVGNVGRLSIPKNHRFILDIFSEIKVINKNAVLLLVGEGELKNDIEYRIKELGVQDSVILTGKRSDVGDLLSAMDVFLMPSLWEGLPVALVEAQTNGVCCFVSCNIAQKEVCLTDLVNPISLDTSAKEWAQLILKKDYSIIQREMYSDVVKESGFTIECIVNELEKIYFEGVKRE